MLPKSKRLSKEKFNEVYNFGTNVPSPVGYFKISSWRNPDELTKIACVSGRKGNKKAADRNRIRRRGYAVIEGLKEGLPEKGYGIIWFLPKEALTLGVDELEKAVEIMINSLNDV